MGLRRPVIAVFDAGTGGGRCAIFDLDGKRVSFSYCPWAYRYPVPGKPEIISFDPAVFWHNLLNCAKDAVAALDLQKYELVAFSATTQREGIVLLDAMGTELYGGPNIDERGKAYNLSLATDRGEAVYKNSGHWPEAIFAPGRLAWFRENDPDLYHRIYKVLSINDWIVYRLCGQCFSEPTNAAETLLFDVSARAWNSNLMAELGLGAEWFAPIVECGTVVGALKSEVAAELGIPAGIPVAVGAADTQAALLGSNVTKVGQVCVVAGSTTPVQQVQDYAQFDEKCRIWTSCHVPPDRWVLEANARRTGLTYRKLAEELYDADYDALAREVEKVPAGSFGSLAFLGPVISDVRSGPRVPFCLINSKFSRADAPLRAVIVNSFLESIAFAVRANWELLRSITKLNPEQVTACGGGMQSHLAAQLLSDVLRVPVTRIKEPQTAALGAAICTAVGLGLYPDVVTGANEMAPEQEIFYPNHETQYDGVYEDWINWYHQLVK